MSYISDLVAPFLPCLIQYLHCPTHLRIHSSLAPSTSAFDTTIHNLLTHLRNTRTQYKAGEFRLTDTMENIDAPVNKGWFVLPGMKRKDRLPTSGDSSLKREIPFLKYLPITVRGHFIAMMGEFAGTFMFLLFALGGTNSVNTAPLQGQPTELNADPAKLLFISLCFGMSLAVNAWVFFRISGGLFNPAVS